MMKLVAVAVLWVGLQEKNEGLEALQKMEKKIGDTPSIKITIKGKGVESKPNSKQDEGGEATVSLGTENRVHIVRTDNKKRGEKIVICDGATVTDGRKKGEAPKKFRDGMALTTARAGILGTIEDFRAAKYMVDVDPATIYTLADVKLGAAEKVGDEEATVVEYVLKIREKAFLIKAKVWISKKTDFPLRRTFHISMPDDPDEKDHTLEFDEVYTVETEAKFADELFKIKNDEK